MTCPSCGKDFLLVSRGKSTTPRGEIVTEKHTCPSCHAESVSWQPAGKGSGSLKVVV